MAAGAALALALWLLLPPMGVEGAGPPPIQDGEFTFLLPAGRKQCFYQSAPANASLETEYQVVIGGAGLDVDFTLESPQGVLLVSESRKADGVHTVEPTEAGDYKLCFDNSFSTISDKLVFFELIFDSLQDDEEVEGWAEAVEPEEMLDVKMEDIKESIETMKTRLERSIQMLTLLRAFEARDRNLQEGNLERVNFWSAVNVAVLLLVAVLQHCPEHHDGQTLGSHVGKGEGRLRNRSTWAWMPVELPLLPRMNTRLALNCWERWAVGKVVLRQQGECRCLAVIKNHLALADN
ncbi:transmembrane emp24 domain-containing protein 1 isoform X1 [Canis lupus familiaris]|uniref:transmembrane emp24 domain-containing protein 1 isoform X1 n=1 Tax=Canis lupus dingo TaxID=286419 RepID=UPI0015F15829|nr:transmembrane emp24 domain-containing protein 1 isoform X1 [Canis lupus dingo]XP_038284555.1 transmembrane emp24 domain-containing protein 1 isoform X1 [Canis lupus familiaris]XP_038311386.1 transmembrane emp24 domain-containing protein 1 isoform X1 [Canis lupus familiaris]XP_038423221.1 transmembrane emp24 domain-containing protein 1 isoform X1 [Canis lupus familiaris]